MSSNTEKLIVKFLTNSATTNDLDTLAEWIESPTNQRLFKDYAETHYAIFFSMNEPDTGKVIEQLLSTIRKEKSFVYRLRKEPIYKYAAAVLVVGIMVSAYFFNNRLVNGIEEKITTIKNDVIKPGVEKATLTLEDGSQIALEKGSSFVSENVNSTGKEIIYEKRESKTKEIKYNYLTIPRGGQFSIKLSDGTTVWINSESQLKYPVSFIEGDIRKVELVYGEAYFDVSSSAEHNGSKFMVFNNGQEVEVLGTEFNIKAYKDESNIYTTLVEGKVVVNMASSTQGLTPGQQLNFDIKNNTSTIKMVDVFNETSWKDGIFSFEEASLKEIMKVLSRWYDVEIVFENKNIENEEFIGLLRKDQNIEKIISTIKDFGIITEYEFKEKTLFLR